MRGFPHFTKMRTTCPPVHDEGIPIRSGGTQIKGATDQGSEVDARSHPGARLDMNGSVALPLGFRRLLKNLPSLLTYSNPLGCRLLRTPP